VWQGSPGGIRVDGLFGMSRQEGLKVIVPTGRMLQHGLCLCYIAIGLSVCESLIIYRVCDSFA